LSSLRELGELEIIRILEQTVWRSPRTVVGFGDDISAVRLANGNLAVLKTDMLVGSTDIPPGMTVRQAARKAVVASVSDMAAKGVRPVAGLVALGLPAKLTKKDVLDIAAGLCDASREYAFPIVGGDTNESEDLTMTVALFGTAMKEHLVLRKGARTGDVVAVTGEFGSTSAGLKSLLEMNRNPKQLPGALYEAVFKPHAQLDMGLKLAASGALTASIDSSDGLAWSLHELSVASRVGILIETIPTTTAARDFGEKYGYDASELALYGGEEYHLVVTVKRDKFNLARRVSRGRLKRIGTVTRDFSGVRISQQGRQTEIPRKGWEHFKR